jgi:hypothetical protein
MNKLLLATNSRTIWTVILLVLVATIPLAKELIPQPFYDMVLAALGVITGYFHLNPSQNYQE